MSQKKRDPFADEFTRGGTVPRSSSPKREEKVRRAVSLRDRLDRLISTQAEESNGMVKRRRTTGGIPNPLRRSMPVEPPATYLDVSQRLVTIYLSFGLSIPLTILLLYIAISTLCLFSIAMGSFVLANVSVISFGFVLLVPVMGVVIGSAFVLWICVGITSFSFRMATRGWGLLGL